MMSSNPHIPHSKYRPDIDGLRAIAVLAVVAFHAFPDSIKGGFIGVDVFFVISGYLISTIIFESLDRGTFSFAEFYARRIKRIFPALILILVAGYLFGWYALLADEYKQLGKHITASAGFVSNFVLWSDAGYFDNSAETKPLLHLWSLGIEEQFYIVWPFLLWLAWKWKFNPLIIIVFVVVVSFYLNITGIQHDVIATFYSPQTRFWELMCGSLLAWVSLHKKKVFVDIVFKLDNWLASALKCKKSGIGGGALLNILSLLGLFILVFGFWRINKELSFPGKWAVVPVLGTVLIISSGLKVWVNRTILSNAVVVWIGLISYPLYLWHWLLLSFARIVESEVPSISIRVAMIALSFVLAWLTYKLVECPIRFGRRNKAKVFVLVMLMMVIGCIGYNAYSREGLSFRLKEREGFINYYENSSPAWQYFEKINLNHEWRSECAFFNWEEYAKDGNEGDPTNSKPKPVDAIDLSCYKRDLRFDKAVLIWGDSHAQMLSSGLIKYMPKSWQVLQIASAGCFPNPNMEASSSKSQCDQSNYFAIKTIKAAKPDVVVVAQSRYHSAETMAEIAEKLAALNVKKVLFVGPSPNWTTELPKLFARQLWVTKPRRTWVGVNQNRMRLNEQLLREFNKTAIAEYVDIINLFCNDDGCLTYTGDDIKSSITSWDYWHLTPSASQFLAKNLLVERIVAP